MLKPLLTLLWHYLGELIAPFQERQRLIQREERFRSMVQNSHDIIGIISQHGLIDYVNPGVTRILGYAPADLVGLSAFQHVHPEDVGRVQATFVNSLSRPEVPVQVEFRFQHADDPQHWVYLELVGTNFLQRDGVVGVVVNMRDVTEKYRLEQELQKTERLESLGLLAGGIAHDFNNILTALMGNLALVRLDRGLSVASQELLSEAEAASLRARGLTQQLLTFAKGGAPVKETVRLADLLRDTVGFALRGSNVESHFELAADLWAVEADRGQLAQVIENLTINAVQAMRQGGRLTVRAENLTSEPGRPVALEPGLSYIRFDLSDCGEGIAPQHLEKIFDPFFTTKPEGTGLGLATSFSIVKRHQGLMQVESELGQGTSFHIYLPALTSQTPPANASPKAALPSVVAQPGQRILLLEDDPAIQLVTGRILTMRGYRVEVAAEGGRAVELYQTAMREADPFDLVIMDLTIPGGMGGKEALGCMLEIDPAVRAIVASGYSNDPIVSNYRDYGFSGVLSKPYRVADLDREVGAVVGGRGEL